jgi:hypothetical protein
VLRIWEHWRPHLRQSMDSLSIIARRIVAGRPLDIRKFFIWVTE